MSMSILETQDITTRAIVPILARPQAQSDFSLKEQDSAAPPQTPTLGSDRTLQIHLEVAYLVQILVALDLVEVGCICEDPGSSFFLCLFFWLA